MKTIKEMARKAGVVPYIFSSVNEECLFRLKAFAELVRADERETCAKVCEKHGYDHYCGNVTDKIAETIRARGQA